MVPIRSERFHARMPDVFVCGVEIADRDGLAPSSIASSNPGNDYSDLGKIVQAWPPLRPELQAVIKAFADAAK